MTTKPHLDTPRTRWTSGIRVPGDGWVYVTPGAREIFTGTALVPGWRRIAAQGPDKDGDFALFGGEESSTYQFVRATDCDTFPVEVDTTAAPEETALDPALASVNHTTTVALATPATADQISRALTLIPLGWFTTLHTYADRIEIVGTHEETRG